MGSTPAGNSRAHPSSLTVNLSDSTRKRSRTSALHPSSGLRRVGPFLAIFGRFCLLWAQILPNNRSKVVHSIQLEDGLLLIFGLDHQIDPFPLAWRTPPPPCAFYV